MDLPLTPPLPPMEAETRDELPRGDGWLYEPKWDGFRCLAFRDGGEVYLQSKAGKPLGRYFPDVVAALRDLGARRFVLDGELVIEVDGVVSFGHLQLRLHPAASRVAKLVAEHPARLAVFDLLVDERRTVVAERPLTERRERLERFAQRYFGPGVVLSPASRDLDRAERWMDAAGGSLDGVIAKRLEQPYRAGERDAVVKVKRLRTADCVVAGWRRGKGGGVGSLLLGLYDTGGALHHVGHTSAIPTAERRGLAARLTELSGRDGATGFTGRSPGGPSRWRREGSGSFLALPPELVAEVEYDQVTDQRFRHGTRFLRWRPDKAPEQCRLDQLPRGAGIPRE